MPPLTRSNTNNKDSATFTGAEATSGVSSLTSPTSSDGEVEFPTVTRRRPKPAKKTVQAATSTKKAAAAKRVRVITVTSSSRASSPSSAASWTDSSEESDLDFTRKIDFASVRKAAYRKKRDLENGTSRKTGWTEAEEQRLCDLVANFDRASLSDHGFFALIKEYDSKHGDLLSCRTNVRLNEKAQQMLVIFAWANAPLRGGWKHVKITKSQIQARLPTH